MRYLTVCLQMMVLVACLAGCGSNLRVTTIQVGRSLNADKTVASHTTIFRPEETVYVSVQTAGVGDGTLRVRWAYGGRVLSEPEKRVSSREASATEFHLQSGDPFPPGDYSVEVFLDGQPVGSREFRVEYR